MVIIIAATNITKVKPQRSKDILKESFFAKICLLNRLKGDVLPESATNLYPTVTAFDLLVVTVNRIRS